MEMKFGIPILEQLGIFQRYLEFIGKLCAHNATIMIYKLTLNSLEASMVAVGSNHSFTQAFFENKTSLSTPRIHLSIGKVCCKLDRAEEGLNSFNTALELFRGL